MDNNVNVAVSPSAGQRGPAEHERRQQILAAAGEHFRHYGYRKTTVADLAKSIGLSTAYIYEFYDSKLAIGEAVCSLCVVDMISELETGVNTAKSKPEALRSIYKCLLHQGFRLMNEERRMHDIFAAAFEEKWNCLESFNKSLFELIRRIIVQGREAGEFARKTPREETCRAICRTTEPFFHPILLEQDAGSLDDDAAAVANLVIRSLSI